jgi:hypothetical protein
MNPYVWSEYDHDGNLTRSHTDRKSTVMILWTCKFWATIRYYHSSFCRFYNVHAYNEVSAADACNIRPNDADLHAGMSVGVMNVIPLPTV